jgi:hypothetical protein
MGGVTLSSDGGSSPRLHSKEAQKEKEEEVTITFENGTTWKPLIEPVRFRTVKDGIRALVDHDYSQALRDGDPGFDEAFFEVGLLYPSTTVRKHHA